MKRIVCVYLGDWPIQRLVAKQPELRWQRVVLYAQDARGQRVSAISPAARRDRVRFGMPLSEAQAILKDAARAPRTTQLTAQALAPPVAHKSEKHAPVIGGALAEPVTHKTEECGVGRPAHSREQRLAHSAQPEPTALAAGSCDDSRTSRKKTPPPQPSPRVGGSKAGDPRAAQTVEECGVGRSAHRAAMGDPRTARTDSAAHFLPHDRAADRAALAQLALSCESLAPRVGLEPGPQPECLFLDVSGVAHLFGGEAGLLEQVQRHFQRRGYTVCAVLADTIGAAWGLAKFGGESDFARLPIEALRLAPATSETLRQLGVERVEQIRRLPRADLWARFGDEIHHRLDQASGVQEEVLDWLPPPDEFYAQRFLDFPTTDATTIQVIAGQLVEQLCRQLRARQRGGLHWQCRLYSPEEEPLRIDVSLFQPAAAVDQVMPLIQMQLEQQGLQAARRPHARRPRQDFAAAFSVHHLSVSVSHSAVLVDRQRLLFDENPRLDKEELAHLINRLTTRLGAPRVLGARLLAEAQPELACRFEPLIGPELARRVNATALHGASPLQRPLHVHAPIAVQVVSAGVGGPPTHLALGDERSRVARCWGPERIETGWWRGPTVRRDYWRVELEDGRWLWLFCDLRLRQWFCHGEF